MKRYEIEAVLDEIRERKAKADGTRFQEYEFSDDEVKAFELFQKYIAERNKIQTEIDDLDAQIELLNSQVENYENQAHSVAKVILGHGFYSDELDSFKRAVYLKRNHGITNYEEIERKLILRSMDKDFNVEQFIEENI